MKKIIIIILSILLVGGIGVFLFFKFSNVSDDIDVDTVQETQEEIIKETTAPFTDEELKNKQRKVIQDIKREKEEKAKELTPLEKYYQKYKKDVDKQLGKTSNDVGLARENFPIILNEIFINNNWNKGLTEAKCRQEHKLYFPKYLSQKFIDKYSEKGIAKVLEIEEPITLVSFIPEPEGIYIKLSINYDEKIIYLIADMTKDYKIEDVEIDTIIDTNNPEEKVKLNRFTYFDGILNYCLGENYKSDNKFKIEENLNLEDKGNNKLNEKLYQYLGTWEDENGFTTSFEEKFINITVAIEEDGKDYSENYTIMFDHEDGELTDLKFLVQKKKFLGNTENREKRTQEELEEAEKKQNRDTFYFNKELEKELKFQEELDKRFKQIEGERKIKENVDKSVE